jgi:hypothetical protein
VTNSVPLSDLRIAARRTSRDNISILMPPWLIGTPQLAQLARRPLGVVARTDDMANLVRH